MRLLKHMKSPEHTRKAFTAFLFLGCFLAAFSVAALTEASAEDAEEVYAIHAGFAGAEISTDGSASLMTIYVLQDGIGEVDLWVTEESVFVANPLASGLESGYLTFSEFAERFIGQMIDVEFVVRGDEYFVTTVFLIDFA
jgi:hypothetical protein